MNASAQLLALRWSFCAFLMWASAETFLAAWSGRGSETHLGAHGHLLVSAVEFGGAAALLIPRLAKWAAATLCVVCAIAGLVSLAGGEAPLRFVYYAATAVFLGFSERVTEAGRKAAPLAP